MFDLFLSVCSSFFYFLLSCFLLHSSVIFLCCFFFYDTPPTEVYTYGHTLSLHDALPSFSGDIADGEVVVSVGPSGCGKSTLLRMIAGLEVITAGEVAIGGRVVNDLEPKDRDIAMVFQNYALYPHMTVYDNMAYGLKIAGKPRSEKIGRAHV